MKALVVAHYQENLDWLKQVNGWDLQVMSDPYNPAGREASRYLGFLKTVWWQEYSEAVFCQGNPFNHDADFLSHLGDGNVKIFGEIHECEPNGMPACDWTPLHAWAEVLSLPKRETYRFIAGAQFRLSQADMFSHPKDFYWVLEWLCNRGTHWNNKAAWVMERLWGDIFPSLGLYEKGEG